MLVAERGFDIGQRVRELRRERVLTQEELSAMSGVHATTISDLERGAGRASAQTTKRLARGLGVEVTELTARRTGGDNPTFPGGANSEEHQDAVLDYEEEQRRRLQREDDERGSEGGSGAGGSPT